jgi:hypothetical protein
MSTVSPKPRWHSPLLWVLTFAGSILFISCAGCAGLGYLAYSKLGWGASDEELVRRHILSTSGDPAKVQFVKWGPHMTGAEFEQAMVDGGFPKRSGQNPRFPYDRLIRVVYRAPAKTSVTDRLMQRYGTDLGNGVYEYDEIFVIMQRHASASILQRSVGTGGFFLVDNPGDNWRERIAQEQLMPGSSKDE